MTREESAEAAGEKDKRPRGDVRAAEAQQAAPAAPRRGGVASATPPRDGHAQRSGAWTKGLLSGHLPSVVERQVQCPIAASQASAKRRRCGNTPDGHRLRRRERGDVVASPVRDRYETARAGTAPHHNRWRPSR